MKHRKANNEPVTPIFEEIELADGMTIEHLMPVSVERHYNEEFELIEVRVGADWYHYQS